MSSCGSVPSSLPVKPDPEGQEEQDDLLMSYLNADCLATDNSHWPPLKALDPPSPPFSTSSSDNSLPGCNSPSDTNTEEAAMNSLLYLQALHGQPVDYTQWLAVAAASAPLHPSSVSPQPPALAPELFTKLPQHFVPPIYLHQQQPHPESNVLSTTPDTATASSSSSYSSSSDSEQPKKKRGRKKKEAPPLKQRSGSVVAAPSAIAPAPLRPLAPIRPAVVAQPSSAAPSSDINVIKTENNDLPVKQESAEEAQKAAAIAKRQERLIKNRAAALLSRKRKREHLTALEEEKQRLSTENAQLKNRMATLEAQVQTLEKENQELRRRLGAKQDSSPPSKNHLATTSKNTKATGVVFMIILFSFALFSLPARTTNHLTVGGSPRQLSLTGLSSAEIEYYRSPLHYTTGYCEAGVCVDNKVERATLDGAPATTSPAVSTPDLILLESVRPYALRSWIDDKIGHASSSEKQSRNKETALVRWSSSFSAPSRHNNDQNARDRETVPRIYLYSDEFSQVAPVIQAGNFVDYVIPTEQRTPNRALTSVHPILSLISPFAGKNNTAAASARSEDSSRQQYLQIDVQVLGSRVIDGNLLALDQCPFATSLLDNIKDDLVTSPLSSTAYVEDKMPKTEQPSVTCKQPSDWRVRKGMRRKLVDEERAKKLARVVM